MCSKNKWSGICFASFALGMLLALCCPTKFLIFVLALSIIILGLFAKK